MNVCMFVCAPHIYSAHGGETRLADLLELELQMVLSCMWMLATKHGFFVRSVNALNLWVTVSAS